jgi:3-oxoacyl-[acyl-carrier protein] reductase
MKERYCVVTGASRGIGLAIASYLMKKNWSVALCSRTPYSDLNKETQELITASNSTVFYLDLMDSASIKALPSLILKWCNGMLHGLVNNAGVAHGGLISSTSIGRIKEVFETNFFSHLDLTQRLVRFLSKAERAAIVNISSISAFLPQQGTLAYGSSKLALAYATKVMAAEFASKNIGVNAIAPAIADTDMLKEISKSAMTAQLELMALQRPIKAEEVATLAYFLLAEAPESLTGQIIKIDAGMGFL